MANTKFRVQAGALVFEMEGPRAFVQHQIEAHRGRIETILDEQARIIRSGKSLETGVKPAARRGRPPKHVAGGESAAKPAATGRRRGRQPSIIRESSLTLRPSQVRELRERVEKLARGSRLGKDASVFAIAHYLCKNVLKSDTFTAGDVTQAYRQMGSSPAVPPAAGVDVVQMLRNLSASSIGKQWVARNPKGNFSLTARGNSVGKSGEIVGRRGRKAGAAAAVDGPRRGRKPGRPKGAKRGRPGRPKGSKRGRPGRPKTVKTGKPGRPKVATRGPGRPKGSTRGPGRPKGATRGPGRPKGVKRGPGRPPKSAAESKAPLVRKPRGRPAKKPATLPAPVPATMVLKRRGRPPKKAA